jgi:uncharacterized glyoxalase superfamily protein PhnB
MQNILGQITLLVDEYDKALSYYTELLGFELLENTPMSPEKRWVVIAPKASKEQGCKLLLAKANTPDQKKAIGNQTGGRVFLFLYTNQIETLHQKLVDHNVEIAKPLRSEYTGKVFVFKDLYGNLWDVIQRN